MSAAAKAKAQFFYDLQRLRIATNNRIIRAIEHDDAALTEEDRLYFKISGELLESQEKASLKEAARACSTEKIYPWLEAVKGIGPTMAMVLISQFDIHKAVRPSQFWSFAGLGVVNGRAPKPVKGEKLRYNSWLRSKLIGVLGPSFLKCTSPVYRPIYDGYKLRCQSRGTCSLSIEKHGTGATWYPSGMKKRQPGDFCTEGHIHNQAMRQMVKIFLLHFWNAWREVENLPIVPPYAEAKLGLKHGSDAA